jgi:hypothetical protein
MSLPFVTAEESTALSVCAKTSLAERTHRARINIRSFLNGLVMNIPPP